MTSEPDSDEALGPESGLGRKAILDSSALGGSLALSWTLVFVGQIALRRVLESDRYGTLAFIESITVLVLSMLAFGVDTYIRREVAICPSRAVEIARPLGILRWASAILISVVTAIAFGLATDSIEQALLAGVFGLAQAAVVMGQTNAAYLHAIRAVRAVTQSAIVTKVLWLVALVLILIGPYPIFAAPLALLASEWFRNAWLRADFRRRFGRPRPGSPRIAFTVIRSAAPYYVDSVSLAFTSYVIPALLGLLATDQETGYFQTARQVISVPMFFVPLLAWVLTPMLSKLHEQGSTSLWTKVREIVDSTIVPLTAGSLLIIPFSAAVVVALFGESYRPAANTVAMLVPGLALTFMAVVLATGLIADGHAWTVTRVNLITVVGMIATMTIVLGAINFDSAGSASLAGATVLGIWEGITVAAFWQKADLGRLHTDTAVRLILSALAGGVLMASALGAAVPAAAHAVAIVVLVLILATSVINLAKEVRAIVFGRGAAVEE